MSFTQEQHEPWWNGSHHTTQKSSLDHQAGSLTVYSPSQMSLIKFTLNQIWRLRENRSMLQLWWVSVIDPDSVQPQRTPVRILILDCSFLGVIINDRPAERASAQSARSLPHTFEMRREMTHQTLVTASWLPLVCSEHSWKLLWRAHDLFNTCWLHFS